MRNHQTIAAEGRELLDKSTEQGIPVSPAQLTELVVEFMESVSYQLDAAGIGADLEPDPKA